MLNEVRKAQNGKHHFIALDVECIKPNTQKQSLLKWWSLEAAVAGKSLGSREEKKQAW